MSIEHVPKRAGTYALCLYIAQSQAVTVGQLGRAFFAAGTYVYVGSAFGPGGLRARLGRHVRTGETLHWHIDYVRAIAAVRGFCYAAASERLECRWSQALAACPEARIPVAGFGSSDCNAGCDAHLIWLPADAALSTVGAVLDEMVGRLPIVTVDFGMPPNRSTIQGWLHKQTRE